MAVPAMSAGSPMRFNGICSRMASPKASRVAAIIFDSNGPGAMAFTVMLSGASRAASTLVMWWTAALDAEYE